MEQITAVSIRQRENQEIWAERIAACRNSRQSVKAWCRQNKIGCSTYYSWEKRLLGEASRQLKSVSSSVQAESESKACFTEIQVMADTGTTIAVIHGQHAVCEIQSGISAELLTALTKAMNDHA